MKHTEQLELTGDRQGNTMKQPCQCTDGFMTLAYSIDYGALFCCGRCNTVYLDRPNNIKLELTDDQFAPNTDWELFQRLNTEWDYFKRCQSDS